jgi:hypothetical protein
MKSCDAIPLTSLYDVQGNPVSCYVLQTLILYECEKHPREEEWEESCIGDRITGILLQLISCLQVGVGGELYRGQDHRDPAPAHLLSPGSNCHLLKTDATCPNFAAPFCAGAKALA